MMHCMCYQPYGNVNYSDKSMVLNCPKTPVLSACTILPASAKICGQISGGDTHPPSFSLKKKGSEFLNSQYSSLDSQSVTKWHSVTWCIGVFGVWFAIFSLSGAYERADAGLQILQNQRVYDLFALDTLLQNQHLREFLFSRMDGSHEEGRVIRWFAWFITSSCIANLWWCIRS